MQRMRQPAARAGALSILCSLVGRTGYPEKIRPLEAREAGERPSTGGLLARPVVFPFNCRNGYDLAGLAGREPDSCNHRFGTVESA
jgi:hypothetical protein